MRKLCVEELGSMQDGGDPVYRDLSLLSYWAADQLCRIPPHAQLPNSCPTLNSQMGPCEVLEKMGEVVYRWYTSAFYWEMGGPPQRQIGPIQS